MLLILKNRIIISIRFFDKGHEYMSEKILDLLKVFLEKYLIPTVVAVVFSFI